MHRDDIRADRSDGCYLMYCDADEVQKQNMLHCDLSVESVGFVVVVVCVAVVVAAGMYVFIVACCSFLIYAMITVAFLVVDVVDAGAANIMKNRLRGRHSFGKC